MKEINLVFNIYGSSSERDRIINLMADKFWHFREITKLSCIDYAMKMEMPSDDNDVGSVPIRNATDLVLFWYEAQASPDQINYCTTNFHVFSRYKSWEDVAHVIQVEKLDGVEQAYIIAKKLGLVVNDFSDFVNADEVSAIF